MAIAIIILAFAVLALAVTTLHIVSNLDNSITQVQIDSINACRRLDERIDTVLLVNF